MIQQGRASLPVLLGRPYKYIRLEWSSELSLLRVRTESPSVSTTA